LLDDAIHSREPEPRSLAWTLRGEKRLEDSPARDLVHAHAGVAHRQHDVGPWLHGNAVLAGVLLVDLDVPRLDGSLPPWRLEY